MIIRLPEPRPPQGVRRLTRQQVDALWESGTVSFYGKQLPARRLRGGEGKTVAMLHKGRWKLAGNRPRVTFRAGPAVRA